MLDANGHMELAHVTARPNLTFSHLDIFSAGAPALLRREAAGEPATTAKTEPERCR